MEKQFEQAAQIKLRFDTTQGRLTVEDLFDLPLTSLSGRVNLNDIAKGLARQIKTAEEVTSFVDTVPSGPGAALTLAFDLVKHVIGIRVAERDATATAMKKKEEKQKILALIADKQDEALRGKSLEELQKMVEAL